jgi:hypothetical protein
VPLAKVAHQAFRESKEDSFIWNFASLLHIGDGQIPARVLVLGTRMSEWPRRIGGGHATEQSN